MIRSKLSCSVINLCDAALEASADRLDLTVAVAFPPESALSRPARLRKWADGSRLGCPARVSAAALVSYARIVLFQFFPYPAFPSLCYTVYTILFSFAQN